MQDRKIAASQEIPVYVEGSRPSTPSPRTERYQIRTAKKSSTAETKRGYHCQAKDPQNSLEPTAERRYPEAIRNSEMPIRAPSILRQFMTKGLQNEPWNHEAMLDILEGTYQEGDDTLNRKLEVEGLQLADNLNKSDSMAGTEAGSEAGTDED